MGEVSVLYRRHIKELGRRALDGDTFAMQSLCCLALVCQGWRHGDPDPADPEPDPGESKNVIFLAKRTG